MHAAHTSIHPETPQIVLKSVFLRYDEDNDGQWNAHEFEHALLDLGVEDEMEQRALFALADCNNSKAVRFEEFLKLIQSNKFEMILSSPQDYEFVIQTYKIFQQYDENGDGEITWDEFYFYLQRHGYCHAQISQYWYHMDQEHKLVVSFEGFWKGFKAIKRLQLQQQQCLSEQAQCKQHAAVYSKVMHNASMFEQHSWSQQDENNVFVYMKTKLKPIRPNPSPFSPRYGRVLEDAENEKNYQKLSTLASPTESEMSFVSDETCGSVKGNALFHHFTFAGEDASDRHLHRPANPCPESKAAGEADEEWYFSGDEEIELID